jgi:hypothetical protein
LDFTQSIHDRTKITIKVTDFISIATAIYEGTNFLEQLYRSKKLVPSVERQKV